MMPLTVMTSLCEQLPSPVQSHSSQTAARLRLQSWSALTALGLHWDCTGPGHLESHPTAIVIALRCKINQNQSNLCIY